MRLIDADEMFPNGFNNKTVEVRAWDDKERIVRTFQLIFKDAQAFIDSQPTVDAVPKWIPCSERMPEEGRYVLMCFKRTEFTPECVVLFEIGRLLKDADSNEQYWDIDDCFELRDEQMKNVVAWMPLPEYIVDEVTK